MKKRLWSFVIGAALLAAPAAAQSQGLTVTRRGTTTAASLPTVGRGEPAWMAAHFINVGQGAATLFEFSCGLVLVDTGGADPAHGDWTGRFAAYLDRVFRRRPDLQRTLDLVVLTHPHKDHTRGATMLTDRRRYPIRQIVTNAQNAGSGIDEQKALTEPAARSGVPVDRMAISMLRGTSGVTRFDTLACNQQAPDIQLLWGSSDRPRRWIPTDQGNNHSVVVRIDFGRSSFLVTGDLEEPAQRAMIRHYAANPDILDADVYQVGHHGSRNGTLPQLVRAITPELAVIGAGDPSRREPGYSAFNFGHPNRAVIKTLTDPPDGITLSRPARRVAVGINGQNPRTGAPPTFEFTNLDRAIFSTGWDGNIVIFASFGGEKRVLID